MKFGYSFNNMAVLINKQTAAIFMFAQRKKQEKTRMKVHYYVSLWVQTYFL